jgi:hypothetical protein
MRDSSYDRQPPDDHLGHTVLKGLTLIGALLMSLALMTDMFH